MRLRTLNSSDIDRLSGEIECCKFVASPRFELEHDVARLAAHGVEFHRITKLASADFHGGAFVRCKSSASLELGRFIHVEQSDNGAAFGSAVELLGEVFQNHCDFHDANAVVCFPPAAIRRFSRPQGLNVSQSS